MAVYTDNPASAAMLLSDVAAADPVTAADFVAEDDVRTEYPLLVDAILGDTAAIYRAPLRAGRWKLVLARDNATGSQYDQLIALARKGTRIPDHTVCIARAGTGFHGFRHRAWSAGHGNIHLSVYFEPDCAIDRFDTVFAAVAAVSVVEAVDHVAGLHGAASIKWVNDVLVDGRKVAGVLAYTQTRGPVVTTAILGIGVNVETTPVVERSPFVPSVASLRDVAPDPAGVTVSDMLHHLLAALDRNYRLLLTEGYRPVMDRYRQRSAVIGRDVTICAEDRSGGGPEAAEVLASGRVATIGDGLELHLEGSALPVTAGRLIMGRWQSTS